MYALPPGGVSLKEDRVTLVYQPNVSGFVVMTQTLTGKITLDKSSMCENDQIPF